MHPPPICCDKKGTSSKILSQSNQEKNNRETEFEGQSIKYLTSTAQNCEGH